MLADKRDRVEVMDGAMAARLNDVFHGAGLADKALVCLTNRNGSVLSMAVNSPAEAADILRRIDNDPLFSRGEQYRKPSPVVFSIDRADSGLRALTCVFRDPAQAGSLWLGGQADLCGPKLDELATALAGAGDDWQRVNFIHKNDRSHLRLVHG